MRLLCIALLCLLCGCVDVPVETDSTLDQARKAYRAELTNHMEKQAVKLDESLDLSAKAVNAVACLSEDLQALKAAIEQLQNKPEPVQAVLPPIETVTADEVRQIISEALESVTCKCPTPAEVVKQPAKPEPVTVAPNPFQTTPVGSNVICSGGVCQPVRTYVPQPRQKFLGRLFGR